VRDTGRHEEEVAGTRDGVPLEPLAIPHDDLALEHVERRLVLAVQVRRSAPARRDSDKLEAQPPSARRLSGDSDEVVESRRSSLTVADPHDHALDCHAGERTPRFAPDGRGNTTTVDSVKLETARTIDRDELVDALRQRGLEVKPLDENDSPGLEVLCDGCEDVLAQIETWLAENELPLVPVLADERVFLRPPGG
jgi:hypothetical protein